MIFYPLALKRNFLPFSYYPDWGFYTTSVNGENYELNKTFKVFSKVSASAIERDCSGLSILFPSQKFASDNLRRGKVPLWDPYIGCGLPTFSEGQFRPFNPFFFFFYLFPSTNLYCLSIFFEILFGYLCMLLFLRSHGLELPASIVGGLLFAVNPYIYNRLSFSDLQSYIFLPLLLYTLKSIKRFSFKNLALASLPFIIMGHIGHPEMCLINTFIASLYFIYCREGNLLKKLYSLIVIGIIVFLSLVIYIAPLMQEYFSSFSYKAISFSTVSDLKWEYILTPLTDVFVLPIIISFSLLAMKRIRDKIIHYLLVWFIFSLIYLFPIPFLGPVSSEITLINVPHFYFKFVFWFCLSLFSAFGFNIFLKESKIKFLFVITLLASTFMGFATKSLDFSLSIAFPQLTILIIILIFQFSILAYKFIFRSDEKLKNYFIAFSIALILFPYAYPISKNVIPWNTLEYKKYDIVDYIREKHPNERSIAPLHTPYSLLPPNNGSIYNVRQTEANVFLFPNNFFKNFGKYSFFPTFVTFGPSDVPLFIKSGATLLLLPKESRLKEIKPEFEGKFGLIYKMDMGYGRLFFANKIIPISSLEDERLKDFKSLEEENVLVESCDFLIDFKFQKDNKAIFVKDEQELVQIKTENKTAGFLVLRDSYHKDFKAFIDGKRTKIYRVDGCFRGVLVPEGKHLITFKFVPVIFYVSATISSLTQITIIILLLIPFIKRRPH